MTGFHPDDDGDWVAELSCGHNQHVRHRPPFQERAWVVTAAGREGRLGGLLACPLCDRAELPEAVRAAGSGPVWDETTIPPELQGTHRLADGVWAVVRVHEGRLHLTLESGIDVDLEPGHPSRAVPPAMDHRVEPRGPVRFSLEFFVVQRDGTGEAGGDPACWAAQVCPECGAMPAAGHHRAGCSVAGD